MRIKIAGMLLLMGSFCFGQTDTETVPFVAYWSFGDTYDFKVTKIKLLSKEGQITKNDSSSYIANFEVIDSTEARYKIKWSYKTNLSEFNIPANLLNEFSKYQTTEVIYLTDEVGQFIEIENWEEIADMMKGMFADLVNVLSEQSDFDKDELTKVIQPLLGVFESKEGIEQLVFKELHYMHFPFGVEFTPGESIEYEDQIPNMFGGRPIRSDAKIYLTDVDFDNSYCVLVHEMKLNADDTRKTLVTALEKMGLKDDDLKKAMKTAQFEITDYNRFEFYYYPGIPIRIEAKREAITDIENMEGKRIDRTIIEWIE